MTIFRLYLMNRLKEGNGGSETTTPRNYIDRRKHERFLIKDKKITLGNKDDILLIQNISKGGFNTETNDRTFERLSLGEIYKCRMRYSGETYLCEAQVKWKENLCVGFEVKDPDPSMKQFMTRIILPQKIGNSLKKVTEDKALKDLSDKITWYLGEKETHIVTYKNPSDINWLVKTQNYILSYDSKDLLASEEEESLTPKIIKFFFANQEELSFMHPKKDHLTLVEDIVMASFVEEKEQILNHLSDFKRSEVRLFRPKKNSF